MFKAIYNPEINQAAAYITPNQEGMSYKVISIDELEKASGINIFPFLKENIKTHAMVLGKPKLHN